MENKIINFLSKQTGIERANIKLDSKLAADLAINSFDLVVMICDIEEEFNLYLSDELNIQTVKDLINLCEISKQRSEISSCKRKKR